MKRRKRLFWGIGIAILVIIAGNVVLRSLFSSNGTFQNPLGSGSSQAPAPQAPTPTATPPPVIPPTGAGQPFILLNPGVVSQGGKLNIQGSDFDPKATIEFFIKQKEAEPGTSLGIIQADRTGSFVGVTLAVPAGQPFGNFIVVAQERKSTKKAETMGLVQNGGAAVVKLNNQVGKVGDTIVVSAKGFAASETVNVFWNNMASDPVATLQADQGGGIGQQALRVPFGAQGANTFIFEGARSQVPVVVQFYLLGLYPVVTVSNYFIKADNVLSYSGKNFGPNELVAVFLGQPSGQAIATVQTNNKGGFTNAPGFLIPFSLKGKQTLYFLGSLSRAETKASFTVAPYTPVVQPSTYGGGPGTTISFYAAGFARNETVQVAVGADKNNPGKQIASFTTDGQGKAKAFGAYTIPDNAQPGKLSFTFIGSKSGGTTTATITVSPVGIPGG